MRQQHNLWFKTFALQPDRRGPRVRYIGYREILIPEYKKSAYIRCVLEFECEYIPVIDPHFWFYGSATEITSSACILVVQHTCQYQKLRTGILMPQVREVINLNSANQKQKVNLLSSNMQFVLKLPKKTHLNRLLNYSHAELIWCERQKQADEDFAAFEKKLHATVAGRPLLTKT